MSIWRWADWIAPVPPAARISLGEGNTPLVRSRSIGPKGGLENLWFKLELCNPTGSYKDRFGVVAISQMVSEGGQRCIATSSGNAGSALAAYSAAAGIDCEIAVIETAPPGKLQQMMAYGAEIYRIRGFGLDPQITADVLKHLERAGRQPGASLQITAYQYCPVGMTGVQTLSYELAEQAEAPWDHVFCQAGGGGLTLAVARGFAELVRRGRLPKSPRIECVQPAGNDTMAGPLRDGADRAHPVQCTAQISGLQVASVIDGDAVVQECRASGGTGHVVDDQVTWNVQARLAREEGIFCEPAAAVALAGALQAAAEGRIKPEAHVACLITGTAFKDPASIDRMLAGATCPIVDYSDLRGSD